MVRTWRNAIYSCKINPGNTRVEKSAYVLDVTTVMTIELLTTRPPAISLNGPLPP